jgi:uncharacterized protein YjbI with pentapeptide repeats
MEGYIDTDELRKLFSDKSLKKGASNQKLLNRSHPLMLDEKFGGEILIGKTISGSGLAAKKVSVVKFYDCEFKDCDLTSGLFWMCTFQKCTFQNCIMDRVVLRKCEIDSCKFIKCNSRFYLNISEAYIYHTSFSNCSFEGIEISGTDTYDVEFKNSTLSMGRFQANFTYRFNLAITPKEYLDADDKKLLKEKKHFEDVIFHDCIADFMDFRMMNFIDTEFKRCELSKCAFTDCKLYEYNFDESNNQKGWGTNLIDLSTLIESENISQSVLKTMFNISGSIQPEIKELLNKKILSSVFISYSLKDNKIANAINNSLKTLGVTTFLWERDAPGGKTLKHIMKSSIDSKDRILFIASENSLKSEACHFELSEGRKKQDLLWKTILFPIHIDNFLFEIEKDQIRPKEKRDEFWTNITELREINSLDFSEFKDRIGKKKKFETLVLKLIDSLKIE